MNIKEYIKDNILYLDGGMGTLLQAMGLKSGELPENRNISHADDIVSVHKAYFDAGSNVVNTNTFGANALKFNDKELEDIISAAIANAKKAAELSRTPQEKWVALDIGPTGRMLKPLGDLYFEDAVSCFAKTVKLGVKYGADLIFIETMNDTLETKAALLAAKENSDLPVFVSNAYGLDGKLMTGAKPLAVIAMLEGLGADAIGVNCSFGPKQLCDVVKEYIEYSSLPVIFKPNAGLPVFKDGKTEYDVCAAEFAEDIAGLLKQGVAIAGGCCGTTPEYIKELVLKSKGIKPKAVTNKGITAVSSYSHAVVFGNNPILIGERINPTGKPAFKEALKNNDTDYILKAGIAQQEKGVHILDVNVGLPEIDEEAALCSAVYELQSVTNLPLQIDTANISAMESALRIYNGKPMINSVNGKKESMDAVFPLAKKYGGLVVALTLDEDGIPKTAEGRKKIAEKILKNAQKYGIDKKDIIFDPLALTVSADNEASLQTLKAVKMITGDLNCRTILGVSNVSFGLPARDVLNSNFFTLALYNGLSAAIMNPYSEEMLRSYYAFLALSGKDKDFSKYIEFSNSISKNADAQNQQGGTENENLQSAVKKGLKEQAARITGELLKNTQPLDIVNGEIIPALNSVGTDFENKTVYLPQLLMAAEAAKCAFEIIKSAMAGKRSDNGCKFVIATVKGDIHDIGKNIVKLLLENYGFPVIDLGKDVPPEKIVETAVKEKAKLVGLSALMTTTVPSMEETIKLLRKDCPDCKIAVGGAVLTKDYAQKIGADFYGKDAMDTVRYAEKIKES